MLDQTPESILLKTVHGSRLYGLHSATSDYDTYVVTNEPYNNTRKARHIMRGLDDVVTISLSEFMRQCADGVPQALEALYSPLADVNKIQGLSSSFMPDTGRSVTRYTSAIYSFGMKKDTEKSRRHALRLSLNLRDILEVGKFTPRLTPEQVYLVYTGAQRSTDDFLALLEDTCPVDLRKLS